MAKNLRLARVSLAKGIFFIDYFCELKDSEQKFFWTIQNILDRSKSNNLTWNISKMKIVLDLRFFVLVQQCKGLPTAQFLAKSLEQFWSKCQKTTQNSGFPDFRMIQKNFRQTAVWVLSLTVLNIPTKKLRNP